MRLSKTFIERYIFILLLGFGLLLVPDSKDFWYDEQISILISNGFDYHAMPSEHDVDSERGLSDVVSATKSDNGNGLLYNVLLYFWQKLFVTTPFNLALFSVLLGTLALGTFYTVSQFFIDSIMLRLGACLLLLVNLTFLGMANEIRSYMLGCLMCLLVVYYGLSYLHSKEEEVKNLVLSSTFSVLAFLSHFFTLYIIFPTWIIMLIRTLKQRNRKVSPAIVGFTLVVSAAMVYALIFLDGMQTMQQQNSDITVRMESDFNSMVALTEGIRIFNINTSLPFSRMHQMDWMYAVEFIILLVLIGVVAYKTSKSERHRVYLLGTLAFSGLAALLSLAFFAGHGSSLYFRYFLFSVPFQVLLLVKVLRHIRIISL